MSARKVVAGEEAGRATTPVQVVREPSFVRMAADEAVVIDLGDDFEISFLSNSPIIAQITRLPGQQKIDFHPTSSELARVRISASDAISMAMNVIERSISKNFLKNDLFLEHITNLVRNSDKEKNND
jgi:hypothetical protein